MMTNRANATDAGFDDAPHVRWERLNDFVDGRLTGAPADAVRLHLAECPRCRRGAEGLRALAERARQLPPAIEPGDALWGAIAASIGPRRRPRWSSPRWLAAAAVVLMLLSSGATALLLRAPWGAAGGDDEARVAALPAGVAASEAAFLADVAELDALLAAQRGALSPATIAVVERSMATIDAAIAEARAALLVDPSNLELAQLLATNYRQKVELMRRAAEIPNSI